MKKYKKGEIAEIILSVLLATGVVAVAIMAPNALQIFKYFKPQNAYERARIKRSVALLERRKFIKKKEGGAGGYFTLTAAGKIRAMRRKIETMKIAPQKNWDGKWRIVMFDISEEKRWRDARSIMLSRNWGAFSIKNQYSLFRFHAKQRLILSGNVLVYEIVYD